MSRLPRILTPTMLSSRDPVERMMIWSAMLLTILRKCFDLLEFARECG